MGQEQRASIFTVFRTSVIEYGNWSLVKEDDVKLVTKNTSAGIKYINRVIPLVPPEREVTVKMPGSRACRAGCMHIGSDPAGVSGVTKAFGETDGTESPCSGTPFVLTVTFVPVTLVEGYD